MNLPLRAMLLCLITAPVLAPMPSFAQPSPQVLPVKAVPHLGFSGEFNFGHVVISPDNRLVVSARWAEVKLWDLATARLLRTINGHAGEVKTLTFSPDSKRLLSASKDKTVKLWDLATGQVIRTFEGHSDAVNAVVFSRDGTRMLSASDDETVKLWDVATGQLLRTFKGHSSKVGSAVFSPDGSRVLSGSDDHTARLWDVATGQLLRTFPMQSSVRTYSWSKDIAAPVAYLPDGASIVVGAGSVTLWDIANGAPPRTFELHLPNGLRQFFAGADGLMVSPDGNRIVAHIQLARTNSEPCRWPPCPSVGQTVKADRATVVWDVATGRQLRVRITGSSNPKPAISSDGTRLLMDSELEDTLTGQVVREFRTPRNTYSHLTALSPNGDRALVAGGEGISIWDISTGQLLKTIEADKMISAAFSQEGDRVFTISQYYNDTRNVVTVWDISTGKVLKSFDIKSQFHRDAAAFSADRRVLLIAVGESVELWDVSKGALTRKFTTAGYVRSVAISPDVTRVAIGADRVTVWDAATGQLLREIPRGRLGALAFSPDSTKLISAEADQSMQVWDIATGQSLLDVAKPVRTAVFAPDGKHIVARYYPNTMTLWDIATKQVVHSVDISAIPDMNLAFAISNDAARFLVGTSYGAVFWSMQAGEPLATLMTSENGEWVAFTPEGYFDGTKNAAGLFTVVRGLDVIASDEVEKTLRRPSLLQLKLKGSPTGKPLSIEKRQ